MDRLGRDLQIVFLEIPPERILEDLMYQSSFDNMEDMENFFISEDVFCQYSGGRWPNWSDDENSLFFKAMKAEANNVFKLPVLCGQRYLDYTHDGLRCRFEQTRVWRDTSHAVGQDLITTAYLAFEDLQTGRCTLDYSWDAILRTDNHELNMWLSQGLAENHYHLKGSTQNFPLTWCCLMNFPNHSASKINEIISVDRFAGISRGKKDNVMSHKNRILLASCLRAILYQSVRDESIDICEMFNRQKRSFLSFGGADRLVNRIRYIYGSKRRQSNGSWFCLDYAMTEADSGHYRLLAGERRLMYNWFKRCLDRTANKIEQRIFYLYLLLKSQFRREIVQANSIVGFKNFQEYQNRKDSVWEGFPAYNNEALYMSIQAPLDKGNIHSLEARIMPKPSSSKLFNTISNCDRVQKFFATKYENKYDVCDYHICSDENTFHNRPFFYVLHFAKEKDKDKINDFWPQVRHHDLRKKIKANAFAIAKALYSSEYLRHRIRGIDACASEIGCRPEVFATEFRFLRNLVPCQRKWWQMGRQVPVNLSVTYHAGEDFLDIADGLRAIDEAVHFLEMRRGDRIGHALALGIEPRMHYLSKDYQIVQSVQDRLDDLVWILFRGDELDVEIESSLRTKIEREAQNLLDEIYLSNENRFSLLDYYNGWQLRGDSPFLYRTKDPLSLEKPLRESYDFHMFCRSVSDLRKNIWAVEMYHRYHYDADARKKGSRVEIYDISFEYAGLMKRIQDKMQNYLTTLGIAVECNPSSNVLIGTFRDYENHPLFRLFSFKKDLSSENSECMNMNVSINTDDLGVFDTSLEFEYALMTHTLLYRNGKTRSFIDIKDYLECIRQNGFVQSFKTAMNT